MPEVYRAKAELFRTLGHPARIRILELLAERDRPVHELLAAIDIEASNLSQQLAVLRRAGLVDHRREGAEVVYAASVPGVAELLRVARALLADILADQASLRDELVAAPGPAEPAPDGEPPAVGHAAEAVPE
ncbi:metalloregulator ArsR/SmtB family transcription factor [Actinotalea sp. M2MS4P-6]|uniref:ArsR/SmtB family transcription factor n=1 Tax=Actinotalea sp. M2MS4P-6 TaxID=2983762 RepID=UPI002961F008|nr:metalloregulator ArsR/SmtB family transcription factor [Actinotalea sp. M2MS4P-6]